MIRQKVTRVGVVAARSANRLYDEKIKPFYEAIKQPEGKEVFASTIMLRASAELFHILKGDYETQLDMLVKIMKEQAKLNSDSN